MSNVPLAERMRPQRLEDFEGQEKILGKDSFLRNAFEKDEVPSLIFWGPPGSGKTTLAHIIANETQSEFIFLSAVESGVKKLQEVLEIAGENKLKEKKTVLFLDEIHRWNKSQQDRLLPHIEKGNIILIGATTENPSFEVNGALLSRARVLVLEKLSSDSIKRIIQKALSDKRGLKEEKVKISDKLIRQIADFSNGDARTALNILENCAKVRKEIDEKLVRSVLGKSHLFYDKNGEEHYNLISALHKSMRGGQADAAVYYFSRMLEGGEDPLFIARRLIRFASEDVGLANNTALVLANACFEACHKIGMPECDVILAQCVAYLAKSPKSIAVYEAVRKAKRDVENLGNLPVPLHLRNAPTKLMRDLEYGQNYKYTPKEDDSRQEYFPEKIRGRKYF
ncbi:MAG: replication-associated recombination protein A [Patescibacteria group bacterium]